MSTTTITSTSATILQESGRMVLTILSSNTAAGVLAEKTQQALDAIDSAADTAMFTAGMYPDTALGLAGTVDGEYFSIPSPEADEFSILYQNVSGSAVEKKRFGTAAMSQAAINAAAVAEAAADFAFDTVQGIADVAIYNTKAAANAAASGLADQALVMVLVDESLAGIKSLYRKESGSLVFKQELLTKDVVDAAVVDAEAAKTAAESARDAAIIGAGVYVDEPTGRAAVADGVAFKVQGSGDVAAYEYRRVNSSGSTLIAIYPAIAAVSALGLRATRIEQETAEYTGPDDLVPLITDSAGSVLLGVYKTTGEVFVAGALDETAVTEILGRLGFAKYIGDGPVYPVVTDASGRVLLGVDREDGVLVGPALDGAIVAPALDPVPLAVPLIGKAINHVVFYGQSLSVGAAAGSLISTTQPYSNITFNGGPRAWNGTTWDFSAFKPLVEDAVSPAPDGNTNRAETSCSGAANYASTLLAVDGVAPADHVILASTAGHGGYRIDQLEKGTAWYLNLLAHVTGAHSLNTDHAVHALCWLQGESDITAATTYATYRSKLEQLQSNFEDDVQAATGQTHPVYLLTYQVSYSAQTNKAMALAQLDLAQKSDKIFMVTPTYHMPHAVDNVHLTAIGYKWIGAYFGRAYAAIVRGEQPQWLNPRSATVRGSNIRVRFDVPTGPMVLDDANLAATTDKGFKVLDNGSPVSITSISVDGRDVIVSLAAVPSGSVVVRYGLDYLGAGLTITSGGSGNLRDSTDDVITISGVDRPLWHVCPAFEISAIKLGE